MKMEYRLLVRGEAIAYRDEILHRGEWHRVINPSGRKCGKVYHTVRRPVAPGVPRPDRISNGEAVYRVPVTLFPPRPIDRTGGEATDAR